MARVVAPTLTLAPIVAAPTSGVSRPGVAPTAVSQPHIATSLLPTPDELRASARLRWGKRIPRDVRRWAYLIVVAGRRHHIDPHLIAAVMTMESGGDPSAWNTRADARGLMQVLHGPFDPANNIEIGTSMLAGFLHDFHNLTLALAAYNAGPGAVKQYGGVPPYRETQDYVVVVAYLYDLYGHRALTRKRRAQYRATVRDLHRFARQRKKIHLLTAVGAPVSVDKPPCPASASCEGVVKSTVFPTMDPFWPMPGSVDPLQWVGPTVTQP